jgi:UDP-2,4-diacetamido-2,4,6-trideoxy-beta-L-altropyranose hydrolase
MRIAFRADASLQIGTGHIMRCLTLADALSNEGAQCIFICRPHPGNMMDMILQRGHALISLLPEANSFLPSRYPRHAKWLGADWISDVVQTRQALRGQIIDWLVVDHYALDYRWEKALRNQTRRILVIDDLADRLHDCDLLLDQNLGHQAKDYFELIGRDTRSMIGPKYALLRPEFAELRKFSLKRRSKPKLKNLLITMGGVDQGNVTSQVLDALTVCNLCPNLNITVVMGLSSPWLREIKAQALKMTAVTQVLVGVENMAQIMAENDLCIGAAGSTAWELCCLGVPNLLISTASNQSLVIGPLVSAGATVQLKREDLITIDDGVFLKKYIHLANNLSTYSSAAADVTDGLGVCDVIKQMV